MDQICSHIYQYGPACDLNHLDVSQLSDLSFVFFNYKFTGDVSKWNTENVTDMSNLFRDCTFDGDISGWNTSKATNMDCMFLGSSFSGSIGSWNLAALQSYDSVFDRFNDSILGYLGVLQGKYELPDTFPRAAQFHQLRAITESLDLDPLGPHALLMRVYALQMRWASQCSIRAFSEKNKGCHDPHQSA